LSKVKWGDAKSDWFEITSGVRQGGILLPVLFSVFVNDILIKLSKVRRGCFIKSVCCNSIMYADDLILLAFSLCDLQDLVNLCKIEFDLIDMDFNVLKSAYIRVGTRNESVVHPINLVFLDATAWQLFSF